MTDKKSVIFTVNYFTVHIVLFVEMHKQVSIKQTDF